MRSAGLDAQAVARILGIRVETVLLWTREGTLDGVKKIVPPNLLSMLRKRVSEHVKEKSPRTVQLDALMNENKLDAVDVGRLLARSAQTVRMWRCESKIIPEHTLTVLELKIKSGKHLEKAGVAA